jgi:hypothetical protein
VLFVLVRRLRERIGLDDTDDGARSSVSSVCSRVCAIIENELVLTEAVADALSMRPHRLNWRLLLPDFLQRLSVLRLFVCVARLLFVARLLILGLFVLGMDRHRAAWLLRGAEALLEKLCLLASNSPAKTGYERTQPTPTNEAEAHTASSFLLCASFLPAPFPSDRYSYVLVSYVGATTSRFLLLDLFDDVREDDRR